MTSGVPESAVRLVATGGAGLTFILDRHDYAPLDKVRLVVFVILFMAS
jgi:hypothetical protein